MAIILVRRVVVGMKIGSINPLAMILNVMGRGRNVGKAWVYKPLNYVMIMVEVLTYDGNRIDTARVF